MVLVTAVGVGVFAVPLAFTLSDLHREEKVVRLERSASEASSEVPTDFPKRPVRFDLVQEATQVIGLYGRDGRRIAGADRATPTRSCVTRCAARCATATSAAGSSSPSP